MNTTFNQSLIKGNHITRLFDQRITKNGIEICIHGTHNDFAVWMKTETTARKLFNGISMQEAIIKANEILTTL